MSNKKLICIVGATAIGKTDLSIFLAKKLNTEIISADSRQFYKEMSIGTAVPSNSELKEVSHHFIHNLSILDSYSVGQYETEAIEKINSLFEKYDNLILVGGSGLYIDAVLYGLDKFPDVQENIRLDLRKKLDNEGLKPLQDELQKLDPEHFKSMDNQNPQRVLRALEVCLSSSLPYSHFLSKEKTQRGFTPIIIGLQAKRDFIYKRIHQRIERMLSEGLLDEVSSLFKHKDLNALQTVGYKEFFLYFEGKIDLNTAIEEIKKNTRRYAKRQLTWFNKMENIQWFDILEEGFQQSVLDFIKNNL